MYEEHLLPPAARLLHIGPPKTGTTAVQSAFSRERDRLPEFGAYYAGPGSRPREAVAALTRPLGDDDKVLAAWHDLVNEVEEAGERRVVISNERFSTADPETAATATAQLGGDRAQVVMVARPLDALLPSQWQQRVRKRRSMISYDDWLKIVLGPEPDAEHFEHFWVLHDLADQIDRWTRATDPSRVTVVVADEGNRDFLPRLFEGFLGLPEGMLVPSKSWSNRSLDRAEAELLRALDHVADARGWERGLYEGTLKPAISSELRASAPTRRAPILLPEWAVERVNELNEQRRDLLLAAQVRVIGDPTTLAERDLAGSSEDPEPDEVTVTLEMSTRVVDAVVAQMSQREVRLKRRLRRQFRRRTRARAGRANAATGSSSVSRGLAGLRRRVRGAR